MTNRDELSGYRAQRFGEVDSSGVVVLCRVKVGAMKSPGFSDR